MSTLVNPLFKTGPAFGYAFNELIIDSGDVAVATTDLDLNDLVKVFRAAKGFCVTGAIMQSSDIDSATSAAFQLGDLSVADRFISASTIGQAGGFTATTAAAGMFYEFTADTDIYIKVSTAPGTPVAGTVRAALKGYMKKA